MITKMPKILINRFDAGMTAEQREQNTRLCRVVKNFKMGDYAHKLVPHNSSESADASADTNRIQNFAVALRDVANNTYSLYGLGISSGKNKVFYKDLTVNASNDLDDSAWVAATNGTVASGTAGNFETFVYYKNQGEIYGARDSRYLFAFSPTGTAMVDNEYDNTSTWKNITEGLVHSKDDICYIGIDNKVIYKNGASAFAVGLTLPVDKVITSLAEYGNYLAIACAPVSGVGKSTVYLWDRDVTLTVVSETVDWGEGSLQILEEIEGNLIGISIYSRNTSLTAATFQSKLIFRQYSGGYASVFQEIVSDQANNVLNPYKQKFDQYLYFTLGIMIDGQLMEGVWKIGRVKPTDPFAVSIDKATPGTVASNTPPRGFFLLGDYMFISYTNSDGTTYYLSKTKDGSTYADTSTYETNYLNMGDIAVKKQLVGITVITEDLPASSSVVLKYLTDGATDFSTNGTTILTHNTEGEIRKSANLTASGGAFPLFNEMQFQLASTGGAVILALALTYKEIKDDIYG